MLQRLLSDVFIIGLSLGLSGQAQTLHGRVVSIADGDTITILDRAHQQHRIRFNGIDAPEKTQPFSARAKAHVAELVAGKDVTVVTVKTDVYGRLVGTVMVGDVDVNLEQLRAGRAWYYREYARDVAPANRPIYEAAEAAARGKKIGLWSDPAPTPPWTFRHEPHASTAAAQTAHPLMNAPSSTAMQGRVIGNRRSRIYHVPGCRDYEAVAELNRVYFETEDAARAAGFRKAKNCSS
jgi:endonuclease YncB( thermonuclease family)